MSACLMTWNVPRKKAETEAVHRRRENRRARKAEREQRAARRLYGEGPPPRLGVSALTARERYLGFKALPPPGPNHDDVLTVDEAARFIHRTAGGVTVVDAGVLIKDGAAYREAYRDAAARLHPDANAG